MRRLSRILLAVLLITFMAGAARSGADGYHGFLLTNGKYSSIDYPGAIMTQAFGINDAGQIVGSYDNSHGFLLTNGVYTSLDYPSGAIKTHGTLAHGINDSGQIVGYYYNGSKLAGFLLTNGVYTSLDYPGVIPTWAYGINDADQIVGTYYFTVGFPTVPENPPITINFHGFINTNKDYTSFNYPVGYYDTYAYGINDSGQIVGWYTGIASLPTSALLFSSGLLSLLGWKRYKQS